MPFNTTMDGTKAPFNGEIMTLTNDEVVEVKTKCDKIIADFVPTDIVLAPNLRRDSVLRSQCLLELNRQHSERLKLDLSVDID